MSELVIDQETVGEIRVLAPQGRIDSTTSSTLETAALDVVNNGTTRLVVDLSDVDYISSAGLRVILLAGKKAKAAGGALVLAGLQPTIRDVFEISGFLRLFDVTETRAEAVDAA